MKNVYRLLAERAWEEACANGSFEGSEHDRRDGFIHLSTASQVAETALRHYAGQANLLLLGAKIDALGAALRFEASRGGALFPHLYAPLPVAAVTRVVKLELDDDGRHVFPSDLDE